MNQCMTVTSAIIIVILLLRILFLIAEVGYYSLGDDIIVPTNLRGFHSSVLAYEAFEKIHNQVLMIAGTGGHRHKYNLCYKDPEVIKIIEAMVREAFPDSVVKSSNNGTCTIHKISW